MPYIISAIVAVLVVIGAGFGINKYYSSSSPEPLNIEIVETPEDAEAIPDVQSVSDKIEAGTRTTPRPTATRAPAASFTPPPPAANPVGAAVISNIRITSITSTGATVSWTTNIPADTQVEYGPLTTYGSVTTLNTTKSTSHTAQISGLTANRTYHLRVRSRNISGVLAISADYSFDTLSGNATADEVPEITGVTADSITGTSARITWDTNIDADGKVEYGKTTSYASSTSLNTSERMDHTFTLSNLLPDTTYNYRVRSKTSATTEAISSNRTFRTSTVADTTPPQISGINVLDIMQTSVRIVWVTNEPSNEAVEWGATSAYGAISSNSNTGVTSHSVILDGLGSGETYHYRVRSIDGAGNVGRSVDLTFSTAFPEVTNTPDPDTTSPVISSITMTPTHNSIIAQWITNEASDSTVYYRFAGSSDPWQSAASATLTLNHSIVASSGIVANNTYEVRVSSRDAVGNIANSTEQAVDIPLAPTPSP